MINRYNTLYIEKICKLANIKGIASICYNENSCVLFLNTEYRWRFQFCPLEQYRMLLQSSYRSKSTLLFCSELALRITKYLIYLRWVPMDLKIRVFLPQVWIHIQQFACRNVWLGRKVMKLKMFLAHLWCE